MQSICASNIYRAEDISGLHRTVQDLEKRLPFQSETVQIPYENTRGGFELFNVGVTDLGPELSGWYGAPGINVAPAVTKENESKIAPTPWTTIFLVGDGFSVHETRVIAGGREVEKFDLLSRQIMQITVPSNANTLKFGTGDSARDYVDIHIATPYGVTNHLLVPALNVTAKDEAIKKLQTSVSQIEKNLSLIKQHAVEISLEATELAKLKYLACKEPSPSNALQLRPDSLKNAKVDFTYKVGNPAFNEAGTYVEAGFATFRNGFLHPIQQIDVTIGTNPVSRFPLTGNQGTFSIALDDLTNRITESLTQHLTQSDIKDDKISAEAVFYFRLVDGEGKPLPGLPIRVYQPLPIEVNVSKEVCGCCEQKASASNTAPSEAQPTPASSIEPTEEKEALPPVPPVTSGSSLRISLPPRIGLQPPQ